MSKDLELYVFAFLSLFADTWLLLNNSRCPLGLLCFMIKNCYHSTFWTFLAKVGAAKVQLNLRKGETCSWFLIYWFITFVAFSINEKQGFIFSNFFYWPDIRTIRILCHTNFLSFWTKCATVNDYSTYRLLSVNTVGAMEKATMAQFKLSVPE